MTRVPLTLLPCTKAKPSHARFGRGGQEGDYWSPEVKRETRDPGLARAKPLGDGATGRYGGGSGLDLTSGRRPFLAAAKAYLEDVKPYYRESTLQRAARDLRVIDHDLRALRKMGRIPTTNPQRLSELEIGELLLWWKTRPSRNGRTLDPSSQAHLLKVLGNLLGWCGNPVLDMMRKRKHVRFPRELRKPIAILDPMDLDRLRRGAESLPDWEGCVARFLVAFLPATGLRPKEVRLARREDIDLERWTIGIAHPKGEGSWAPSGVEAPILPFAQEAVFDFLEGRRAYLEAEEHEALIPLRRCDGSLTYWSEPLLRKLKGKLAKASGVRFHLKTFRATFAQMAKNRGAAIEAVSRALRHKTTKTTEEFYARIRADDAFSELRRVFEKPDVRAVPKTHSE